MIQTFIEYLKASGLRLVESHECQHVFANFGEDDERLLFTLYDTEEEQPEVLLWICGEVQRKGLFWRARCGTQFHRFEIADSESFTFIEIDEQAKTVTAAAIRAVCSLTKGAPDA